MLDKQDETTGEIKGLRSDIRSLMDDRMKKIEAEIVEIKDALKRKGII